MTLNWSPTAGSTGYEIEYGTAPGNRPNTVSVSGGSESNKTITGLTNETEYFVAIRAKAGDCQSDVSGEVSAIPTDKIFTYNGQYFEISTTESRTSIGNVAVEKKSGQPDSQEGFKGSTPVNFYLIVEATGADNPLDACVTFKYNEDDIPDDIDERTLTLYRSSDDGDTWENLGGTLDIKNNTITLCNVTHLSQWTLGGFPPPKVPVSSWGIIIACLLIGAFVFTKKVIL